MATGLGKSIEGSIVDGTPVILVDDIVNSRRSRPEPEFIVPPHWSGIV
jgi:hypothetical protein